VATAEPWRARQPKCRPDQCWKCRDWRQPIAICGLAQRVHRPCTQLVEIANRGVEGRAGSRSAERSNRPSRDARRWSPREIGGAAEAAGIFVADRAPRARIGERCAGGRVGGICRSAHGGGKAIGHRQIRGPSNCPNGPRIADPPTSGRSSYLEVARFNLLTLKWRICFKNCLV